MIVGCVFVFGLAFFVRGQGIMGPVQPEHQCLQQPDGVCLNAPARCLAFATLPTAEACVEACANTSWCSAITWTDANVTGYPNICFFRFDGAYEPVPCAPGCGQTSANKTSGFIPPLPPLPSPTCALNGIPCPAPRWPPEWNLTRSTVVQPWCRDNLTAARPWGLVSLAWDCSKDGLEEGATVARCADLKANGIATRCFMYHNQELALAWLESQRLVMDDAHTAAGWFLRWANGTRYEEPEATYPHGGFQAQAFWDFRHPEATAYFVQSIAKAVASEAIDGSFADDVDGLPDEHPLVAARIGLNTTDLAALRYATQAANAELITALVLAGKYVWQAFGAGDGVKPAPAAATCTAWMREHCAPAYQGYPLLMEFNVASKNQSLAAFLVVRPPVGYIGFGWYSNDQNWDPLFLLQAGEPRGLCQEGPVNVFTRAWTMGVAALDCNNFTATLPFLPL